MIITYSDYKKIARRLQKASRILSEEYCRVSQGHKNTKRAREIRMALDGVSWSRCIFDSELFRDYPKKASEKVFYPGMKL